MKNFSKKITQPLQNYGFSLDFSEISESRTILMYKRLPSNSERDQTLQFDGLLWSSPTEGESQGFNWLRVFATNNGITLVVKNLISEQANDIQIPDGFIQGGWIYADETSLDDAIASIAEVIESKLIQWFDNPTLPT